MEFVEGGNLGQFLEQNGVMCGWLSKLLHHYTFKALRTAELQAGHVSWDICSAMQVRDEFPSFVSALIPIPVSSQSWHCSPRPEA